MRIFDPHNRKNQSQTHTHCISVFLSDSFIHGLNVICYCLVFH